VAGPYGPAYFFAVMQADKSKKWGEQVLAKEKRWRYRAFPNLENRMTTAGESTFIPSKVPPKK
jgi:hypothetical protein